MLTAVFFFDETTESLTMDVIPYRKYMLLPKRYFFKSKYQMDLQNK